MVHMILLASILEPYSLQSQFILQRKLMSLEIILR